MTAPTAAATARAVAGNPGVADRRRRVSVRAATVTVLLATAAGIVAVTAGPAAVLVGGVALTGWVVAVRQCAGTRRLERLVEQRACHDELTGLANLRLLRERIECALTPSGSALQHPVLFFLNLDRFTSVNDGYGHVAGDDVLRDVAARLVRSVRPSDTVARVGGDEFAVLMSGPLTADEVRAASVRLAWALDAPMAVGTADIFLTSSQGVALAGAGETAETLLQRADAAMRRAKEQGRARIVHAEASPTSAGLGEGDLTAELRRALTQGEFVLHYQPIVELASGSITGAEALLRWEHPTRGLLPPAAFMSAAEHSGLIVPIGDWVLRQAVADAARWSALTVPDLPIAVAVNLSAAQLASRQLGFVIARSLSLAGLPADQLHLEVTESVLISDLRRSRQVLDAIHELGAHVAADDFGTGYSSLTHVQSLPIDTVKIDKSFVDQLDSGGADGAIVESILVLGASLGLQVVAEGVERDGQRRALLDRGCPRAQGYLFARPMPLADFERLLCDRAVLPVGDRAGRVAVAIPGQRHGISPGVALPEVAS